MTGKWEEVRQVILGSLSTVKPSLVQILNQPPTLSSDKPVNLTCVSEGSRPPAQLTWFKDNRKFRRGKVRFSRRHNIQKQFVSKLRATDFSLLPTGLNRYLLISC